jgi:ketosteroid isomerase-like protein
VSARLARRVPDRAEISGIRERTVMAKPATVDTNLSVVSRCYQAYVDKDRAALDAIIDADFHFTSPLDNRIDRATYFERCWPNSRTIAGFDFVAMEAVGDRVFVVYEGRSTRGHRFRNTEILTVRNAHIVDVEVYFGWSIPHEAPAGGFVDEPSERSTS